MSSKTLFLRGYFKIGKCARKARATPPVSFFSKDMGNPNTLGGQGPLVGLGEGAAQRVFERIACGAPARVMQLMHGCSIASDTWGLATHGSSAGQDRMAAGRQHGSSMPPVDE